MKRILFLILAASLLFACAPKQPKTMEQQAEEARSEAFANADSPTALGPNTPMVRNDPSFLDEHGEDILWLLIDGALLSTGNRDTTGMSLDDFKDK
ncbi:hypothetical protein [uncultured Pseudodesulfovibrio sp.]|uniref:hypothetical protein n=1 Tax=uncultured Pseudodesulfovibrio sp. TaxID=2035858 RepID=UPI0029C66683|nr:hypothetical protein [uncultured Pseudodesulfovibrio sp.]